MGKPQLFCFTYAGGNADFFIPISKDLTSVEVIAIEYSGHGMRHKENLYQSFDELTDDVYQILKDSHSGGDYALFGYSMGSISLIEVLKRIMNDADLSLPSHVFIAAHEPHTKAELASFSEGEMDEWVKDRTIKFGAVPDKLLNNNSFWRTYLPLYRADYSIIGKYKFEELGLCTSIPVTVFYSERDTPYSDMKDWQNYFTGECEFYEFDGTHFFIQEHHQEMADIIERKMGKQYDV